MKSTDCCDSSEDRVRNTQEYAGNLSEYSIENQEACADITGFSVGTSSESDDSVVLSEDTG